MASSGNCYLCGAKLSKTAMQNHILKFHNADGIGQECRLLKIEGADDKNYWLYVDIPVDKTFSTLDTFLRKIWLECCGHLSQFRGAGKSKKVGLFQTGDQFWHEYDMGSTTTTLITVVGTTWRKPQKKAVRLLARNVPPRFTCAKCGAPAAYIDAEEMYDTDNAFYCEKCAEDRDEFVLLPVTNSPRMGVCGYCGEFDVFEFVFPETDGINT